MPIWNTLFEALAARHVIKNGPAFFYKLVFEELIDITTNTASDDNIIPACKNPSCDIPHYSFWYHLRTGADSLLAHTDLYPHTKHHIQSPCRRACCHK
mmetsp:Transcript_18207/g.41478  ORF Transcript_18207/g.41478 Transcript_18207/m.41478 type:complete len:98 (-) Transcript_18207:125-418(-)